MRLSLVLVLIALGVLLSLVSVVSAASLLVISLSILACFILKRVRSIKERRFLIGLFLVSLILRFILSTAYYLSSYGLRKGVDFLGDARGYSNNALYVSYAMQDKNPDDFPYTDNSLTGSLEDCFNELKYKYKGALPPLSFRIDGFVYLIGLIYSMFGYSPLSIKLLNGLLFTCAAIILYFIVRDIFDIKVAKMSLLIILFWPSNLLWSITGLKEAITFLSLVMSMWLILEFLAKRKPLFLVVSILPLFMLYTVRNYLVVPILMALGFSLFARLKNIHKAMLIAGIFVAVALMFIVFHLNFKALMQGFYIKFMEYTVFTNRPIVNTEGISYKIYPQRFYEGSFVYNLTLFEWLVSCVKGVIYFLLVPFPWMVSTKSMLVAYPQSAMWHLLFPFSIIGMLVALRYRFERAFPLVLIIFVSTLSFGLIEGNVGTAFRHRDILMPFYLFFSVTGILNIFGRLNKQND